MIAIFDSVEETQIFDSVFSNYGPAFDVNNDIRIKKDAAPIIQKTLRRMDPAPEDLEDLFKNWTQEQNEDGEEFYCIPCDKAKRIFEIKKSLGVGHIFHRNREVLQKFFEDGAITENQYGITLMDWEDPEEGAEHETVADT